MRQAAGGAARAWSYEDTPAAIAARLHGACADLERADLERVYRITREDDLVRLPTDVEAIGELLIKSAGDDALSRVLGSRGLTAEARSVLTFGRAPDLDDDSRKRSRHWAASPNTPSSTAEGR